MTKEISKLKALISFVILEIILFGVAGAAALYVTNIPLPKAAIFLGFSMIYHLAVAYIGILRWKERIRNPISNGDL